MLAVEHLVKVFPDGTRALGDVSFTVSDGEWVAVVGLSGSGKTTLLRCINRLVDPTSGRIVFDGADITAASQDELRRIRRSIGMIFQQFNLVRRSSVLTNVLTGRLGYTPPAWALFNRFRRDDVRRAIANLERVGLPDKVYNRADALSGGQQQRVAIARALMQEPKLVLADEPVASLDPVLSHSILRYLEEINRQDGITVMCSLHIPSLVRRYATRVIALKAGKIVFDGLPGQMDKEKFHLIYGENAEEVEIV